MSAPTPFSFHDLPRSRYPFTMQLLDDQTREVVWELEVTGPGAIRIPGVQESNGGRPVAVRIRYADGTEESAELGFA
jgi:hypothetical protein